MTTAIIVMLCIGAACGTILGVSSRIFYVYEDPRIAKVEYYLAGANCGGCGYAGCSSAADAVVSGKALPSVCIVSDMDSVMEVAKIMGVEVGAAEQEKSTNPCSGGKRAEEKFFYNGVNNCSALALLYGGNKVCSIGCLGMGDCLKSCKFDAIKIDINNLPVINKEFCVGCRACEMVCPKNIIRVMPVSSELLLLNNKKSALAPCRQTCPAEIDIPTYIRKIKVGDYEGAIDTIRKRNPLLLSCGRVCPHPCESYCRRGIEDDPVSINQLKRFVADYEMSNKKRVPVFCAPETGKKVAIIGGGPAGLSAAFFLKRLGHNITIFESMPKLGGIIRYGIPEYRLPKKVLDWEIDGILSLGIKHECNKTLGENFRINDLMNNGFDAIFLGIGAWSDYELGIDGENLKGCWKGIEFLSSVAQDKNISVGRKAAVVGGGNSAIDCVRTLVRLGAEEVTIVYRRTKEEMPANDFEIEAAEHENVIFQFLSAPVKVIGNKNENVTHLEYIKMELGEPDSSGRRRPVPIEGSETKLEVDMLITAIGQRPNIDFVYNKNDSIQNLEITRWKTISNNSKTLQTSIPFIFTAGDCATGASLVVEAIGGARKAVKSIHEFLVTGEVSEQKKILEKTHIDGSIFDKVEGIKKIPRVKMTELPVTERITSMVEVDLVISEDEAIKESNRCLDCCLLCYDKDR